MDSTAAFQLLRLLEIPGVGPVRVNRMVEHAKQEGMPFAHLLSDTRTLAAFLTETQVDSFVSSEGKHCEAWNQARQSKSHIITVLDGVYPARLRSVLGDRTPPVLMVRGNSTLLEATSVSFCGSRKASAKGIDTARDCAEQLAANGVNVASGYATGVDTAVHRCALESGGTTAVVLAEGILNFAVKRELARSWDWDRVVVVSEFPAHQRWNVSGAMQRNRTICALSKAMILIEARTKGGSIEAGRECLKLDLPLFAAVYDEMPQASQGNRWLLEHGARPLLKSRATNRANLNSLYQAMSEDRFQAVTS